MLYKRARRSEVNSRGQCRHDNVSGWWSIQSATRRWLRCTKSHALENPAEAPVDPSLDRLSTCTAPPYTVPYEHVSSLASLCRGLESTALFSLATRQASPSYSTMCSSREVTRDGQQFQPQKSSTNAMRRPAQKDWGLSRLCGRS